MTAGFIVATINPAVIDRRYRRRSRVMYSLVGEDRTVLAHAGARRIRLFPSESFGQFNSRPNWIENEGDLQAKIRQFTIRRIELHAVGFELLAKCFEVFNFKSDVIQRATLRRSSGHLRG